jgi:hypothetical protein
MATNYYGEDDTVVNEAQIEQFVSSIPAGTPAAKIVEAANILGRTTSIIRRAPDGSRVNPATLLAASRRLREIAAARG